MALSYKARRRWSLVILLIGLPLYVVVASIRRRSGGADLTAKQVHAEVILDPALAATTLSAVKRACSHVGKAVGKEKARSPSGRCRRKRAVAADASRSGGFTRRRLSP